MAYLPNYYRISKVMQNITSAESAEIELFKTKLVQLLDQFFVDTATYTLEDWERELGIPVDNSKSDAYRRSVIKSKLRGSGTITVNLIKNVAESYSNGEVEVIEDNPNYHFVIKFVGTIGIPPNMDDLEKAIEDIKPAHLGYIFEYTYNTYNYLSQFTHDHLALYTYSALREEEVI
ncbi:DUF2313 domain-containing protein [Thermanaerosceptrum fracticalcis]|uniref:DUF2313 domain-containing protein n=2 Tax=Thermanaerosceptrum fracticalcis TaxID=1712410 RepID=A0A7G6E8W3_THEFR|nr:DUF2313 domain-containing protein [Thermanaerosceptrum fracticalcis]